MGERESLWGEKAVVIARMLFSIDLPLQMSVDNVSIIHLIGLNISNNFKPNTIGISLAGMRTPSKILFQTNFALIFCAAQTKGSNRKLRWLFVSLVVNCWACNKEINNFGVNSVVGRQIYIFFSFQFVLVFFFFVWLHNTKHQQQQKNGLWFKHRDISLFYRPCHLSSTDFCIPLSIVS